MSIVMLTMDANLSAVRIPTGTVKVITRAGTTLVSTALTMLRTLVFAGTAERIASAVAAGLAGGLATDRPYHA